MVIKVLFVLLVLCTIALVGAVGAAYFRIRKHMRDTGHASAGEAPTITVEGNHRTGTPSGS